LFEKFWNASPRSLTSAIRRRLPGGTRDKSVPPCAILIPRGPLAGRTLWLSPEKGAALREMAEGTFDDAMFRELTALHLAGSTFWDIGAHVGYHSLSFAALGGEGCRVLAFEPNPFNRERLARNLELNPELATRIEVLPIAVAARDGEMDFVLSPDIESGASSGSFLALAKPPREAGEYANFLRRRVPTTSLDSFQLKHHPPLVLKIDVEGGEQLVLQGAREFLSHHKPMILMEVHNIQLMFCIQSMLMEFGYDLKLIDDAHSSKSRCFVMACSRTDRLTGVS
jgi:FkbM family methyltransferase